LKTLTFTCILSLFDRFICSFVAWSLWLKAYFTLTVQNGAQQTVSKRDLPDCSSFICCLFDSFHFATWPSFSLWSKQDWLELTFSFTSTRFVAKKPLRINQRYLITNKN